MPDALSNWAANMMLQTIPSNCYLAAHLFDPGALGDPSTEVSGGGYVRQPISFRVAGNRFRVSSSGGVFPGMPLCTVQYLAVWTAIGAGHIVFSKQLSPPIPVSASGQLLFAAGDIAVQL